MPTYEMSLILKSLQRPELASAIKRCCTHVLSQGGVIRGMENLGQKPLPYKISNHGERFYEGNYFIMKFDGATTLPAYLHDELKRDTDVIRKSVFPDNEEFQRPCQSGPCVFGELPTAPHDKRLWWVKVHRRFNRAERKKRERLA